MIYFCVFFFKFYFIIFFFKLSLSRKYQLILIPKKISPSLSVLVRDLLLPDGNRVSAFSVASTAIAAAQWSSTQVRPRLCLLALYLTVS